MIVFMAVLGIITAIFGVLISANAKFITHEALGALLWVGGLITVAVAVTGYKVVERLTLLAASYKAAAQQPVPTIREWSPQPPIGLNDAPPATAIDTPTVVSTRTHLGIYYVIMSDGTIRVRTKGGDFNFDSVEAFQKHLQANRDWWAQQSGRQV